MAEDEDTMRPGYDFSDGVRGVTARRYALGATVVAVEQRGAEQKEPPASKSDKSRAAGHEGT